MTATLFTPLVIAAIVIEAALTPLFLHLQRPGANPKSLLVKMICATMFLGTGLLCYFYSGNTSEFALFMIIGLASSWIGDFCLHLKSGGKVNFGVGFVFFMAAHILYLIAYAKATKQYFAERKFLVAWEIIIVIAIIVALFFFYLKVGKINLLTPLSIVFIIYGFILVTMFLKAAVFSIEYSMASLPNAVAGGLCLSFGGMLFCLSDLSLVLLMFNKELKKNHRLKDFNIATYFIAQTLLALSVLFIGF